MQSSTPNTDKLEELVNSGKLDYEPKCAHQYFRVRGASKHLCNNGRGCSSLTCVNYLDGVLVQCVLCKSKEELYGD